jgi:hypothetical protein
VGLVLGASTSTILVIAGISSTSVLATTLFGIIAASALIGGVSGVVVAYVSWKNSIEESDMPFVQQITKKRCDMKFEIKDLAGRN